MAEPTRPHSVEVGSFTRDVGDVTAPVARLELRTRRLRTWSHRDLAGRSGESCQVGRRGPAADAVHPELAAARPKTTMRATVIWPKESDLRP